MSPGRHYALQPPTPLAGIVAAIGILLAVTRDDIVVEYALRGVDSPQAGSTYTTYRALPDDIRPPIAAADGLAYVSRCAPQVAS